jgi:hypothetical protein
MVNLRGIIEAFSPIMGISTGVEAASHRDLDFMLLDLHFLPCHMCFPFSPLNYATLRATLPHFVEIRLLNIQNVTFVEEVIIPPGIASIMIRVLITLGCTPMLLILHSPIIICHHRTCSIIRLQLLLNMYKSHQHNTEQPNSPLCKPCTRGLTLPLHPHVLQVLHKCG